MDVLYNYLTTPVFVSENQFDEEQILGELGCPRDFKKQLPKMAEFFSYYGKRMRKSLRQISGKKGNGVWAPSCLDQ